MNQFHRYVLAHELLAGDWDARLVLADLLTESGEDELAEFARIGRRINRQGDLELAIRLLPARPAIALGCALLDRGLTGKGTVRRHAWLIARLAQVRRLLRKNAAAEQLVAKGQALADYQVVAHPWRDDGFLNEAAHALAAALDQVETPSAAALAIAALSRAMRRRIGRLDELECKWSRPKRCLRGWSPTWRLSLRRVSPTRS
jgi:hypothetical protein